MKRQPRKHDETKITLHHSREGSHEAVVSRVVETTECARLAAVAAESQKLGEFLDWLSEEHGVVLCVMDRRTERFEPLGKRYEELLADYFDIDLKKVEEERRGLLAALQESHR